MNDMIATTGSYVDIAGIRTWHDTLGSGPPLVLLHGGLSASVEWEYHAPLFAEHFTVRMFDRRAHGRTPDPGDISYELMAGDTIGFLETVVGGPAHLVGWSDGGILALMVAARRPDLVAKIVPISANIDVRGVEEPVREMFTSTPADSPMFEHLRSTHQMLSPDGPDRWPVFFAKFLQFVMTEVILEESDLARITAPTLLLFGDDDMVTLEHTIKIYRTISNAELAILPNTSHLLAMERPELVNQLIRDFLLNDPAPTMMPIRRAGRAPDA